MVVQVYCVESGGIPILHRTSGGGNLVSSEIFKSLTNLYNAESVTLSIVPF